MQINNSVNFKKTSIQPKVEAKNDDVGAVGLKAKIIANGNWQTTCFSSKTERDRFIAALNTLPESRYNEYERSGKYYLDYFVPKESVQKDPVAPNQKPAGESKYIKENSKQDKYLRNTSGASPQAGQSALAQANQNNNKLNRLM